MSILRSIFSLQSGTVKVLVFTITLTVLILSGSAIYYNHLNSLEDPRLLETQQFHKRYTEAVEKKEYGTALLTLDKWEKLFSEVPGYDSSYERGVINNNRGSLYIVQFETEVLLSNDPEFKPPFHYLHDAEQHIKQAISIYENWLNTWQNATDSQLIEQVNQNFSELAGQLSNNKLKRIKAKRVEDLKLPQLETPRRLSVSLTNYGVIKRYLGELDSAKASYEKAIDLWDLNYTAQDNLAILLGNKPQKRTIMKKLFPPERDS